MTQSSQQPSQTAHQNRPVSIRRDRIYIRKSSAITACIALVGFALGGIFMYVLAMMSGDLGKAYQTPAQGDLLAPQPGNPEAVAMSLNPVIGPDDAPVTLVEFSDFYCTYCKSFHDQTLGTLLTKYQGRLRYVYRDFPSVGGRQAAEAASCASEQGAYWDYHNALFSDPHAYSSVDQFASLAQSLKLDDTRFRDCVSSGKYRDKVQQDYQAGLSNGVRGTPTFFINSVRVIGAQPLAVFEQIIDQQLQS